MEEDFLVTAEDLTTVRKGQKEGYCLPGFIRWCRDNGYSYRGLLRTGILASELRKIKDPFVDKVLKAAEDRIKMAKEGADGSF